ncbi:hypothetical protein NCS56_01506300 [Fusarium sp. Ph1]|nr:hypothetical protein NCS56_01506300 [Fusarium sp. Ph1]
MTEEKRRWTLIRRRPTLCMISDHCHFSYIDSTSNGIALLFFGWAYILCMTLLEKQHIPMCYSGNISAIPDHEHHSDEQYLTVDIGHASEEEFRWWISLVSPGQVWRSASRKQPVWAIAYTGNVKPLVDGGELEMLSHILALRRPNVAPLWYGIAACGQTRTIVAIVPFLQSLYTPVPSRPIPEVAAWIGSPQSFMDLRESGPYLQAGDQVSRADVWRLRHECWDAEPEGAPFRNPPMCPWPPFGFMKVDELELPVRLHMSCDRHQWVYLRWTWLLNNRAVLVNPSLPQQSSSVFEAESQMDFTPSSIPNLDYRPDHVASERAVGDIFRWAATEMEPTGKDIYLHHWVEALADLEMDGNDGTDSSSSESQSCSHSPTERVKDWVMNTDIE